MTITYRTIKGEALTYSEIDENFRDLRYDTTLQRVTSLGNVTNNIITVSGINVLGNINVSGNIISTTGGSVVPTTFDTLNVNILSVNTFKNYSGNTMATYSSNAINVPDDILDNALFRVNKKVISSNVEISNTYNYSSIGPIEIADGVVVTIANGANWTII